MKFILVMPIKNEEWILKQALSTASLWADYIVVADQNSTDQSRKICKSFSKVLLVENTSKEFNEESRRQILLDAARNFDGENIIFALDADEILTTGILNSEIKNKLVNDLKPGMSVKLQWIMLWKNAHEYRYDPTPEWSENYKHFIYRDDRKIKFENGRIHLSRVPETTLGNYLNFEEIKVLHYAFAEWQRMLAKHTYYLALEKTMGSQLHPFLLNRKYRWFYKEPKTRWVVKALPKSWVNEYKNRGLDITAEIRSEDLYWYEVEVLKFFKEFGLEYFKHLNIWQTDWQQKLLLAKKKGEPGIFEQEIKNPQPWYDRIYYKFFQSFLDKI